MSAKLTNLEGKKKRFRFFFSLFFVFLEKLYVMNRTFSSFFFALPIVFMGLSSPAAAQDFKFNFGPKSPEGYVSVLASDIYSADKGYGFEPGSSPEYVECSSKGRLSSCFVTSGEVLTFSVAVPEGDYRVRLTLGDEKGESSTTVKSEIRRLAFENISTGKSEIRQLCFNVNVRTPLLSQGNTIKLNTREMDYQTGRLLTYTWDDKLTLSFYGSAAKVCAVEIERLDGTVPRVFIIGDSTVTDQKSGGTWGQYLPVWMTEGAVVCNHAESGMTIKGFRFSRRWDKIMESCREGDYLLIQLGTNDEKSKGHDPMWPEDDRSGDWVRTHSDASTDYVWGLATMALEAKRHGVIPVIVSPMTKIDRRSAKATELMTPYGQNAARAAQLADCQYIDLWSISRSLIEALGDDALLMYADGTHTDNYGAYLFSLAIADALKTGVMAGKGMVRDDLPVLDVENPHPLPSEFTCPLEPRKEKPANEAYKNGQTRFGPL